MRSTHMCKHYLRIQWGIVQMVSYDSCYVNLNNYLLTASRSILASIMIIYLLPDTRMRPDPDRIVSFIPVMSYHTPALTSSLFCSSFFTLLTPFTYPSPFSLLSPSPSPSPSTLLSPSSFPPPSFHLAPPLHPPFT